MTKKSSDAWGFQRAVSKRNIYVTWIMTFWCNFQCSYCFQHDHSLNQKLYPTVLSDGSTLVRALKEPKRWDSAFRSLTKGNVYAHAFKNYPVGEWLDGFRRVGKDRKIVLAVCGGEPFLDVKNFYSLLEGLTAMTEIDCIRIDTNCNWKAKSYEGLDFSKVYLNCSFHPEQITTERHFDQVRSYQDLGANIVMVNYVMTPDLRDGYVDVKARFEELGIRVNPAVYDDGNFPKSDEEVKMYERYLDSFDVRNKCGLSRTKGRLCRFPMIGLQLDADGSIFNYCFPWKRIDFIRSTKKKVDSLLFGHPKKCPKERCFYTHMYPFLLDSGRYLDTLKVLKRYAEEAII